MKIDLDGIIVADFETYFDNDYSLKSKELNTSEYIRDPRFLAHCVSLKVGKTPTRVYWYDEIRPAIEAINWSQYHVLAHNTAFDGLILAEYYNVVPPNPTLTPLYVESFGIPTPCYYLDTLSMARALYYNKTRFSLDALCTYHGIPGKNPNILGKMKGHREIPQHLREEASIYCAGDADKCLVLFNQMIESVPRHEIELIDWTIRQFCDPLLYVDQERTAPELERQRLKRAEVLANAGCTEDELQSSAKFAGQLKALDIEPPMKWSAKTNQLAYAFSLQDSAFMQLLVHPNERVRNLMAARLQAKSTIGVTRAERFVNVGARTLPVGLNYFGAHTGRWSGNNRMNMQNLEKEELDADNTPIPNTGELRKSILAPPGHVLVVADSAQIEVRVLAWLAQQLDLLQLFRDKKDPYCALASEIYERPITKADRDPRAVGKAARLGLGFYMGAPRFQGTLAAGTLGPKMDMDIDMCRKIVRVFREKSPQITALWKRLQDVIKDMYHKKNMLGDTSMGVYEVDGFPILRWDGESIYLPNNMWLNYPNLACSEGQDGSEVYTYDLEKGHAFIHSGILTENLVQALARIIIGIQMAKINRRWRVAMMTHDEIVAVAPEHEAEECLKFMLDTMSVAPKWAPSLPLGAEGGYARNYSK